MEGHGVSGDMLATWSRLLVCRLFSAAPDRPFLRRRLFDRLQELLAMSS